MNRYHPARSGAWKTALGLALISLLLVIVAAAWMLWKPQEPTPAKASGLSGKLEVYITKTSVKPIRTLRLDEEQALPVQAGDQMHLQVQYAVPAHTFLIWIDADGQAVPLYPWNFDELETLDLRQPPPPCKAVTSISSPMTLGKGWKLKKGSGLETVLLLARRVPLDEGLSIVDLLGRAPLAAKVRDRAELAILQLDRQMPGLQVIAAKQRGTVDDALDADRTLLAAMERLRAHFDLVQAVRFAHVDD